MSKISIIIPSLNEEEGIEGVIHAIPKEELCSMGFDVQILVVDGNSQDRTRESWPVKLEPRLLLSPDGVMAGLIRQALPMPLEGNAYTI